MTIKKRRSFEAGHVRKFLLIVDESPEVESALYYAASRIAALGGRAGHALRHRAAGIPALDQRAPEQIEEETNKAKALFRLLRRKLNHAGFENVACEEIIREGDKAEEIRKLIDEDEDIAVLVLGASTDAGGPRPARLLAGHRRQRRQLPDPNDHRAGSLALEESGAWT